MRLIDADALPYKIAVYAYGQAVDCVHKSDIRKAPTVDAVPVVRCRECRHFVRGQHLDLCAMSWYGRGGDADCFSKIVHDADKEYCSYGERKEPADGRTD